MTDVLLTPIRLNELESLIHNSVQRAFSEQTTLLRAEQKINPYERLTRKDISKEYRVCYGTIHNAMNKGKLPYEKVGRKTLYKRTDVEHWLKKKGGDNE